MTQEDEVFGDRLEKDIFPTRKKLLNSNMKQKDELLKNLNELLEKVNEQISIWGDLMASGKYPKDECLNHINRNAREKILIMKMIRNYVTEDKELLIKDISARIPYKVFALIFNEYDDYTSEIEGIDIDGYVTDFEGSGVEVEYIRPYLFPMSSMTEKQKEDLLLTVVGEEGLNLFSVTKDGIISNDREEQSIESFCFNNINFSNETIEAYIDWLNKNHFDYRGLIEKGLAINATNLNIY